MIRRRRWHRCCSDRWTRWSNTTTADPAAAHDLIAVGEKPRDAAIPPPELAAWTMVVSEVLNLDETLNK